MRDNEQPKEWWKQLWMFAQAVANAPHETSFKLTAQQVIRDTEAACRSISVHQGNNTAQREDYEAVLAKRLALFDRGVRYLHEATPCDMPWSPAEIGLLRRALTEQESLSEQGNATESRDDAIERVARAGFEQAMRNMDAVPGHATHSKDYPWENEDEPCKDDWRRVAQACMSAMGCSEIPMLRSESACSESQGTAGRWEGSEMRDNEQPDEYTAFQSALKSWGAPDDEFNQYHADEGALYWLWGKAVAWATKRGKS